MENGWNSYGRMPPVAVRELLAVGTVALSMGEADGREMKAFYGRVLGLEFRGMVEGEMRFKYGQREVVLRREEGNRTGELKGGRLGLAIRDFKTAVMMLTQQRLQFEVFHQDGGLTRMAVVRDPAGNWVHLFENRPF